ncbi:hypothetical protein [Candidatus Solirubrobacter pratensis]|uniref:hypothetical protein n=1 Tax=Candidatus Solirubrobacter pratensis TaxID=1298857 RepID=UPI00040D3604|nr:hypothetical protein [Candidatus Solirubrobacter pratensis]
MNPQVPDDKITSGKQFAEFATELLDTEVQAVLQLHVRLQQKYGYMANTADNLEAMRDEYVTRLAEMGILATVDPAPCLYGEPPVVEILGKISGHSQHTYGFDHEQKQYEVRKSKERGEDFLGQKEAPNARREK